MKPYNTYNAEQFLNDSFFIEWVRYQAPDSVEFWTVWQQEQHENLKEFQAAEAQLKAIFSMKEIAVDANAAEEVWQRIETAIAEKRNRMVAMKKWLAAAAVMLLVGLSLWFWKGADNKKELATIANNTVGDVMPGGNKAILTLADGSHIILDSVNDGALAQQGGVQVVKLNDGKIAYQNNKTAAATTASYNTISTPRGGQFQLDLADGTKVWLNAESSLKFPANFTGDSREVTLTGEGYFEVAKNAAKPFIVHSQKMDVKVLGTHFNISAYNEENAVRATLLEGSVEVSSAGQNKKIRPGEQAKLLYTDAKIQTTYDVDVEQIVAWKNGYFSFNNASIKEVMFQLSRWYDIDVVYSGNITSRKFSGSIARNSDLKEVLTVLKETDIHFKIEGKRLLVSP